MKTKAYYIGLTLIIISFIACVISFYLLIFGIPLFLLGAVLVLISKRTIKLKLLSTIVPIVLYFPITFLFLYIYNYSTPKNILIPKNFEGNLRVVYEEKCGQNYDIADGVKTLIFPDNGILILNEDFDSHINYNYYIIDENGKKTKISEILDFKERLQEYPSILVRGSGTFWQSIETNSANIQEKGIVFSDFYLYNSSIDNRNEFKARQKLDSLTTAIVNQCRKDNGSH